MAHQSNPQNTVGTSLAVACLGAILALSLPHPAAAEQGFPDWHAAVLDWVASGSDTAYLRYHDSSTLSWGEAYVLQTYNTMFAADGDTLWLSKLARHAFRLFEYAVDVPLDTTADAIYADGYRGWGTSRYSEQYEEWLVHDGHVCTELARFVATVYSIDSLYTWFGARADSILYFLERHVAGKWHATWYKPRGQLPGSLDDNATYSKWIGGQNLLSIPVNHFAAFGNFALELLLASRTQHYPNFFPDFPAWYDSVVHDAALAFRQVLRYKSRTDAYLWPYAATWDGNDISHAAIELRFAYDCYRAGMHFTETDMRRFAHTLTRHVWANPPEIWSAHLHQNLYGKGGYEYELYTRNWPLMAFFDPLVWGVEAGVLRRAAEERRFGSCSTVAAVAQLAYTRQAAGPIVGAVGVRTREIRGDGDNLPDPGEELELLPFVANWGDAQLDTLEITIRTGDPRLELLRDRGQLVNLSSLDTAAAKQPPPVIRIRPGNGGGRVRLFLQLSARGRSRPDSLTINLNPSTVLLVDDDGGADLETYYVDSVLTSVASFQVWHVEESGSPGRFLSKYPTVVWTTGRMDTATLTPEDRQSLKAYLDSGGKLILFGPRVQDDLLDSAEPDTQFFRRVLHALPSNESAALPFLTLTVVERCIYEAPYLTLSPGQNTVFRAVEPAPEARVLLRYSFGPAGVFTTSGHRVAYLTFGLEDVTSRDPEVGEWKRRRLLRGLFDLLERPAGLGPGGRDAPRQFALQIHPNPTRGPVTILLRGSASVPYAVRVFDVRGRLVWERRVRGCNQIQWPGIDRGGRKVGAGPYLVEVTDARGRRGVAKISMIP